MKLEDLDRYLKPDENGCLIWQGHASATGYGKVTIDGKKRFVHRVVMQRDVEIPPGMFVDHTCHNRGCANRDHLRLVTHKQNMENRAGARRNSISGIRGVYRAKGGKWQVQVRHQGRIHSGGYFDSKEDAGQAATALRNKLFTHNDLDRK